MLVSVVALTPNRPWKQPLIAFIILLLSLPISPPDLPDPAQAEMLVIDAAALLRLEYHEEALKQLELLAVPANQPELAEIRDVLYARSIAHMGDQETALRLFADLTTSDSQVIALFSRYYLGLTSCLNEQPAIGLENLESLFNHVRSELLRPDLEEAGMGCALATGDLESIARWQTRIHRSRLEKSRIYTWEIKAFTARKKSTEKLCKTLFHDFPCAVLPAPCDHDKLHKAASGRQRFERAEKLFSCWAYHLAAEEFEAFLQSSKSKKYHAKSHYYLAEIHSRKLRDDRAGAFAHYKYVYKHGGGSREYALYQMGRCQMNLENYDKALELFEQYLAAYPHGAHSERCTYYLGWLPYDHDNLKAAVKGFDRYLARYKKGDLRTYIIWYRAWCLYRLGMFRDAQTGFKHLTGFGNDIVAAKGWYWMGRVAEQQKDIKNAIKWYRKVLQRWPLSYYGTLSWKRLQASGETDQNPVLSSQLPAAPAQPLPSHAARYLGPSEVSALTPVLHCILLGEIRAARKLFSHIKGTIQNGLKSNPAAGRFWLYSLLEEPDTLRNWGRKNHRLRGKTPSKTNQLRWMLEFPLAYQPLIRNAGRKAGLPQWFLYSIMRQESRYRRGVISWADAVGLLQVIPPTAQRTADALGFTFHRHRMAVPQHNIRLGVGYLGLLAEDFHRQLTLVAASYNAGPDPIREFVADNHTHGWDYLIEEIAYNEARNYCRKVTGHVLK